MVCFRRLFSFGLVVISGVASGQRPVIFPGGVVNAASYSRLASSSGTHNLAVASIATIFGANLAASTATANSIVLPVLLAGTSVTVNGLAAPLFYVSPGQINFQVPLQANSYSGGIVVTTAAGSSDAFPWGGTDSTLGIFTMNAGGCGAGAVLNVSPDGSLSLNSPANSVSPGDSVAAFGTGVGFVFRAPEDGYPAPSSGPPTSATFSGDGVYDFVADNGATSNWSGLAPGFVGVGQFNVRVSPTAREGCAVPFQVQGGYYPSITQPVLLAIHTGGGACVDPPTAAYGEVTWERAFTAVGMTATTETDTVTVSLQASPGKQTPIAPTFSEGVGYSSTQFLGPPCPIPGYRSLDAGAVTVQGPSFGPLSAPLAPLPRAQISGLTAYQASLPPGSIQAGSFAVVGAGGSDVGQFQSGVHIGADIQIGSSLEDIVFPCNTGVTINWTGGDPSSWVAVIQQLEQNDSYTGAITWYAHASDGAIAIPPPPGHPAQCSGTSVPIKLILEVFPDPSVTQTFTAPGLSLGGRQLWRYVHTFDASILQ